MGESQSTLFAMDFNRSIRVEDRTERLSGDAGALLVREIFSLLELDSFFQRHLQDARCLSRITHPMLELLRTELILLAQGYADHNDADRLREDPVLRLAVSDRRGTGPVETSSTGAEPTGLGSQPTLSRLSGQLSGQLEVVREGLFESAARRLRLERRGHRRRYVTVDIDSIPLEVFGQQQGACYNGHYGMACYHPVVASLAETGDFVDLHLRPGNAHSAEGAVDFLLPLLDRVEKEICQVASVRMDAGFPSAGLLQSLEDRGVAFVARVSKNRRLERAGAEALQDSVTNQSHTTFHELSYQADTWQAPRRVVLVVEPPSAGQLFGRHFFLLTSWTSEQMPPECLLELYRDRGTAEGFFGDFKTSLAPALSSTCRPKSHYRGKQPRRRSPSVDVFAANETRLLLNALAYNLMNGLRRLLSSQTQRGWRLSSLRDQVLKAPARVLLHARQLTVVVSRPVSVLWRHLQQALQRWRSWKKQLHSQQRLNWA